MTPRLARERLAAILAGPPEAVDLLEAALLLGVDAAGSLAVEPYLQRADALARAVRDRAAGSEEPCRRLAALRQVVFEEGGFHGNREEYYDPRNSLLHEVMDRRLGIPITLAVLLIALGRRLGWPLRGANFPAHFLVAYEGEELLPVDAFHGGLILDGPELAERWVMATGEDPPPLAEMLAPVADRVILLRMLNNLKQIGLQQREFAAAALAVEKMVLIDPQQPLHHRDLGYLYAWSRQVQPAVHELQRYLRMSPRAEDRDHVLGYIQQVSASGLRWEEG